MVHEAPGKGDDVGRHSQRREAGVKVEGREIRAGVEEGEAAGEVGGWWGNC